MITIINGIKVIHQDLDGLKSYRKSLVKKEASDRIKKIEGDDRWNYHRAERKSRRGSNAEITALDDAIEAITTASDVAELAIDDLTTIEEVNAFKW